MNNYQNNPAFKRYRIALAGLCTACAKLSLVKEKLEAGEVVVECEVSELCSKIKFQKEDFLAAKEELGFTDKFSFMENTHFQGFEIKDGCLEGNPDLAFTILRPWYEGFPEERKGINNFEFEVANYLLAFLMEKEKQTVIPDTKKKSRKKLVLPKINVIKPSDIALKWESYKKGILCRLYQ